MGKNQHGKSYINGLSIKDVYVIFVDLLICEKDTFL